MNANEAEESVPLARGLRSVAVFDVDGVLCAPLMKPLEDHQEPGVMRIHFPHEGKVYTHVFLPCVDVMLRVLVGWGVRVCFFSSADASRNIPVLTQLVDLSFGLDEAARLRSEGQFAIHSKGLLRDRREDSGEYGGKIKDMTRVVRPGEQLEDLVLIEDQPSYAAGDQLPCLRALDIELWNPHQEHYNDHYIKNGAAWILGVFDLLLTDARYQTLALRPALARLLFDHFGEEGRPRNEHRSEAQHQTIDRGLAIIRRSVPDAVFYGAAGAGRARTETRAARSGSRAARIPASGLRTLDTGNARLLALLADKHLPEPEKVRLMEGIVDKKMAVSEAEYQTASQRVRRKGREEGLAKARNAILALAARVVPESMPVLHSIEDLDELQQAADAAIVRKLGS